MTFINVCLSVALGMYIKIVSLKILHKNFEAKFAKYFAISSFLLGVLALFNITSIYPTGSQMYYTLYGTTMGFLIGNSKNFNKQR